MKSRKLLFLLVYLLIFWDFFGLKKALSCSLYFGSIGFIFVVLLCVPDRSVFQIGVGKRLLLLRTLWAILLSVIGRLMQCKAYICANVCEK